MFIYASTFNNKVVIGVNTFARDDCDLVILIKIVISVTIVIVQTVGTVLTIVTIVTVEVC